MHCLCCGLSKKLHLASCPNTVRVDSGGYKPDGQGLIQCTRLTALNSCLMLIQKVLQTPEHIKTKECTHSGAQCMEQINQLVHRNGIVSTPWTIAIQFQDFDQLINFSECSHYSLINIYIYVYIFIHLFIYSSLTINLDGFRNLANLDNSRKF